MSFIYGTQTELLYAMPASGPAVTAAAQTRLSAGLTTTNPPFLVPIPTLIPPTGGIGKSLLIKGGGWFTIGTTAVTDVFQVALDSTAGTLGTVIAKTGVFTTLVSITSGAFTFEVMLTAVSVGTGTSASFNAVGEIKFGAANNLAAPTWGAWGTSATNLAAQTIMIGTPQTAVTFDSTLSYYIELWNTWNVTTGAPTITLTNYMIFGLN